MWAKIEATVFSRVGGRKVGQDSFPMIPAISFIFRVASVSVTVTFKRCKTKEYMQTKKVRRSNESRRI